MRKSLGYVAAAMLAGAVVFVAMRFRPSESPAAPPDVANIIAELTPDEKIAVTVYQQANRSAVNITSRTIAADDFGFFAEPREGSGSGVVLDKQGRIVTNYHVIESARRVEVTLFDGTSYEAKYVGGDPSNDLAVIQIDAPAEKLFPIQWGDSNRLLPGMRVYAIGNPFGLDRTLTTGIVSSLNRSLRSENNRLIKGVIQTDAAINPGNSGGPLLNKQSQLVGINTAIVSRSGQSSGVGLAIPANTARRVVEELIKFGKVKRADAGIVSVFQTERGLLIARLENNGPAARAGLRGPQIRTVRRGDATYRALDRTKADLILSIDGQPVKTPDDMLTIIESKSPGAKAVFRVLREGKATDVTVELSESEG
jgi:S1-C subfamily serine protease